MINSNIVIGRHDNIIKLDLNTIQHSINRIGSDNPNKSKPIDYIPISTDGKIIICRNQKYEVREFFQNNQKENYILLTRKEYESILEVILDFDININVFEKNYPIFKIKYIQNLKKSYYYLVYLLDKLNKLGIKEKTLGIHFTRQYLFRIERKLRFKNTYDYFFAFAYKPGISEVFKAKESRQTRCILAFDFNSMYLDAMRGDFLVPKKIKHIKYKNPIEDYSMLHDGLYRILLINLKSSFFSEYSPFKYIHQFQKISFNIPIGGNIEILLFKNEIEYYSKFFEQYKITEGFYSTQIMKHPLFQTGSKLYGTRKNTKDIEMQNYIKYSLITMHSATNLKKYKTQQFDNPDSLITFLCSYYMLNKPSSKSELELFLDNNLFHVRKNNKGYSLEYIDFQSNYNIFSISSKILANARLKMMKTIEDFLKFDSVEICYANIDSIHISIDKNLQEKFLKKFQYIISDKLGDLKLEAVSDKGYWFDVGRYWLYNDDKLVKFGNSGFNLISNNNPYNIRRKTTKISYIGKYKFSEVKKTHMYNTFSFKKKLSCKDNDHIIFTRYNYDDIYNISVAQESIKSEEERSKHLKISLFEEMVTVLD